MATTAHLLDAAALLRAEHAVTRVLAEAPEPPEAYPTLLEAVGAALGWSFGAAWVVAPQEAMLCAATWCDQTGLDADSFASATLALELGRGEGLPGRVWATGRPAHIADLAADANFPRGAAAERAGLRSGFCFPVRGAGGILGAFELFAGEPRRADRALLATTANLGRLIGQYVERWRAQQALRESDARKSAILDACFDCVITLDHRGRVLEINRATEELFGFAASEMVGRELADLIVPPDLRERHREGLARYVREGRRHSLPRIELVGMRADGSVLPVEVAITRPQLDGPPVFTGYLRDISERRNSERALRALAEEQAALRRVATLIAADHDPVDLFSAVSEEVGRLLGANSANMVRFEPDGSSALVVGGWGANGVPNVEVGSRVPLDGDTVAPRVWRTKRPARLDHYDGLSGELAAHLRGLGLRSAVAAPVTFAGDAWGALIVSANHANAFPPGDEERIGEFAELVAQALANAEARRQLAASRARIVQAGDEERRRLERNLHDGAQQRLVALSLALRMAERRLPADPGGARAMLADAGPELDQALAELRELARGLHPAVLNERGLIAALGSLAARAPVPVELSAGVHERLPEPVEAAAYYLVAESLTNVAKYARATAVEVRVERQDGHASITVRDDGVGGADAEGGTGLRGLTDRVEALGGRLEVISAPGAGTTVHARLPC